MRANISINLDLIPFSIYNYISKKQFSIERYHSHPKDGVVALLQDNSNNGTFLNENIVGPNVKSGLKDGDKIGIAYFSKGIIMKHCPAFKFSVISSVASEEASDPTLIDLSDNNIKESQRKNTTVEFVSDDNVEFLSDITTSEVTTPKKRRRRN